MGQSGVSLRWVTVTGPHAFCDDCEWSFHGDNESREMHRQARAHAFDCGHRIQLQRGQSTEINGRPS